METLYPRNLWQALLLMLAGFAATILLVIPFMLRDLSHDVETLAMGTILFVSIWVVFYVVNRRKGHRVAYNFSGGWSSSVFWWAALFVAAFQVGMGYPLSHYLGHALGLIKESGQAHITLLYAIGSMLIGPILEEFVFRGAMLHAFLDNMNDKRAVLLSSLLFAAIHILPHQVVGAFLLGVLFGTVYARTRNLAHTIMLHVLANIAGTATGYIYGHAAPHNQPLLFVAALAATIAIAVPLAKHLRRKQPSV